MVTFFVNWLLSSSGGSNRCLKKNSNQCTVKSRFIKWIGVLIICLEPAFDVILSNGLTVLIFLSEELLFESFSLKSRTKIKLGWNLLILLRWKFKSKQNLSSSSSFWLGNRHKQVKNYFIFPIVISVTKHWWRFGTVFPPIGVPGTYFNFKTARCGAYWRAVLKRVRRLFQIERNYSLELSKHCDVLFENNKK